MLKRIASILLLSAMLICTSCAGDKSDNSALRAVTVASSENVTVDGAMMTYFYFDNTLAFINNYAAVLDKVGLDPSKPFSEQPRKNGEGTWYDFFLSQTSTVVHYLTALNELAIADGITLTDAEKAAITAGAEAVADGYYGKDVKTEDIANARAIEALAYKYENIKKAELMPTVDEMRAYAEENEKKYDFDESVTVNVRHILVSDAFAGDHKKAVAKAEEILAAFNSGDKTVDSFALLALEYSNDPGSVYSGGLYANLEKDTTVEEFDEWCFDSARKTGDTAVIETEYGAHVMYFEGEGLPLWQTEISGKIVSERLTALRTERFEKYPVTIDTEALKTIG